MGGEEAVWLGETRVGVILCIVNGRKYWWYEYLASLPPSRKGNIGGI